MGMARHGLELWHLKSVRTFWFIVLFFCQIVVLITVSISATTIKAFRSTTFKLHIKMTIIRPIVPGTVPDSDSPTVGTETSIGPAEPVGMELAAVLPFAVVTERCSMSLGSASTEASWMWFAAGCRISIASSTTGMNVSSGGGKCYSGAADSTSIGTACKPKWLSV
ncbi:hypothetical protein BJ742DRAFT_830920 [Cladochytrium replicatum]|nr:hypothetical protein BJ742DRAFT_830920 [Cladochytrium replicatum]